MILRALLFAGLLPLAALAQLQVFEFDGTNDTPVGALVNVGTASPGDKLETRFHVRNIGAGPATFSTLALSGEGFTIVSAPSLPYILAPYVGLTSEAEFDVSFAPTTSGSFSALLAVNTISIVLQGNSAASAALTLSGSQTPLTAGATIGFGSVDVGASGTQGFVLSNSAATSVTVASVVVSGTGFSRPDWPYDARFHRLRTIRALPDQVHSAIGHVISRHAHGGRPHLRSYRPRPESTTSERFHRLRFHCRRQRATEQHHHPAGVSLPSQRHRSTHYVVSAEHNRRHR